METRIKAIITAISKLNYGLASSLVLEEMYKSPEPKILKFLNPALNEVNQDNYGLAAITLNQLVKFLQKEKTEQKAAHEKKIDEAIAARELKAKSDAGTGGDAAKQIGKKDNKNK